MWWSRFQKLRHVQIWLLKILAEILRRWVIVVRVVSNMPIIQDLLCCNYLLPLCNCRHNKSSQILWFLTSNSSKKSSPYRFYTEIILTIKKLLCSLFSRVNLGSEKIWKWMQNVIFYYFLFGGWNVYFFLHLIQMHVYSLLRNRGFCWRFCAGKTLQNMLYFWNTKTHIVFSFRATSFSS